MTIPVRQMLVASKNYKTKCPNTLKAESITIHNTFNDASANNEVQYMINNTNSVSFHFAVDDKEVVQGLPLDRNAWAAGDGNGPGNRKNIHVEICYSKSGGERYRKAEALAVSFIAQLLHERGWGVDRVRKHEDWSGKHCPHRILDEGRWNEVLYYIQKELDVLKAPKPKIVNVTTGGLTTSMLHDLAEFLASKNWYSESAGVKIGQFYDGTPELAELESW